jgi:release factor glutamine methyltransferase
MDARTAPMKPDTVARLLAEAALRLPGAEARAEAEILLADVLGQRRAWLYAHSDQVVGEAERRAFDAAVARRHQGLPVAYITGRQEFWSLPLSVSAATLIPRPETELLVELALRRMPAAAPVSVLDLGTGTGAVALAIAQERPSAQVTGIEFDPATLAMARGNATRLGLDRVRLLAGDWFSAIGDQRFDFVLGNPPYIAEADPHLARGDLRFEPRLALASGPDGLDAIRVIVAQAPEHLLDGGWLMLEHGVGQGGSVRELMQAAGLVAVESFVDLEDRDRVSVGRRVG